MVVVVVVVRVVVVVVRVVVVVFAHPASLVHSWPVHRLESHAEEVQQQFLLQEDEQLLQLLSLLLSSRLSILSI